MFYVYGDESVSRSLVIYAVVICPEDSISIVEETLFSLKAQYGVDPSNRFHCRELFHKDSRRKSAYKNLSEPQVHQMALDLTCVLGGKGLKTTIGIVDSSIIGRAILPVGDTEEFKLSDVKQLIPFAFQGAIGPLLFNPVYRNRLKLWVDPDSSLVRWWGKRRQAARLLSTGELISPRMPIIDKLQPEPFEENSRPKGLEIADLVAYSSARSLAKQGKKYDYVFDEILRLIGPARYPLKWDESSFV